MGGQHLAKELKKNPSLALRLPPGLYAASWSFCHDDVVWCSLCLLLLLSSFFFLLSSFFFLLSSFFFFVFCVFESIVSHVWCCLVKVCGGVTDFVCLVVSTFECLDLNFCLLSLIVTMWFSQSLIIRPVMLLKLLQFRVFLAWHVPKHHISKPSMELFIWVVSLTSSGVNWGFGNHTAIRRYQNATIRRYPKSKWNFLVA